MVTFVRVYLVTAHNTKKILEATTDIEKTKELKRREERRPCKA